MVTSISILLFLCSTWSTDNARDLAAHDYISQYQEVAVTEMYRVGVPASITIAQALHESNIGQSELAQNANNHFGIKCKRYWKGGKYYYKDDDKDDHGTLIESCFRSYETVYDSYIDHSNFLNFTPHYRKLFDLSQTDYMGWAHGLKKAGYATDPAYAEKLISYIEKYDLALLDYHPNPLRVIREQTSKN